MYETTKSYLKLKHKKNSPIVITNIRTVLQKHKNKKQKTNYQENDFKLAKVLFFNNLKFLISVLKRWSKTILQARQPANRKCS